LGVPAFSALVVAFGARAQDLRAKKAGHMAYFLLRYVEWRMAMLLISRAALLLDEVARVGSIRGAADKLNTSPSAVNRHILGLEAQYGVRFFERLPRGMRLTPAGEVLVNNIRRWRREQEQGDIQIQELQGLRRGHARVGIIDSLADDLMPRIFQRLNETDRRVTLDVLVGGTAKLAEELTAGTLDLAICFNLKSRKEFDVALVLPSQAGIAVRLDHGLAQRKSVRLDELAAYELILPHSSFVLRQALEDAFDRLPLRPKEIVTTNSTMIMKALMSQGNHVAVIGSLSVRREVRAGELVFIPITYDRPLTTELSLAVQAHHFQTPARLDLVEIFRQELLDLANDDLVPHLPATPRHAAAAR
jgi:DNA-binding transcriptional LysR family regulator